MAHREEVGIALGVALRHDRRPRGGETLEVAVAGLVAIRYGRAHAGDLVDNAIKFTPAGGKVAVSVRTEGEHVAVEVADTGVRIPPEEAGRVFEPFYRVKGNETQGGQQSSGLGLPRVKGLVDAMGGQISFESRVGGGSTFRVRLPTSATTNNTGQEERDASSGSLREATR